MSLRDDLIRDEGERLDAYQDSLGFWTIGVGHLLGDSPRMTRITHHESMALLTADIEEAGAVLSGWIPGWGLFEEGRQRALLNFTFNLGPKVHQFKNTRALIVAGDFADAADNMLKSRWATQVKGRSIRVTELLRTGKDS